MSSVSSHSLLLVGGLVAALSLTVPASGQVVPVVQPGPTGNFGFGRGSVPMLRLSDLMNKPIQLPDGQGVGIVSDIVLNRNGSILYLVGADVTQQRLFTIPAQVVHFSLHDFALTLPLTPEQFQGLPTFTSATVPDFNSVAYQRSLYTAYGLASINHSRGSTETTVVPSVPERGSRNRGIQAGRVGDTVLDPDDDPNPPNPTRSTEARKPLLGLEEPGLRDLPEKELGIGNAVNNPLRTPDGRPLPKTLTPNAKSGTNGLPGGPKPNPVGPPKGAKNPPSSAGGATGGTGSAPGPTKGTTKPLRNP